MAAQKVVVEGSSNVTASQLKDLFRQIEDGSIDGSYMQGFLNHSLGANGKKSASNLLDFVATVVVSGAGRFVAADHFKVDTSRKAAVKIAFVWDNFRDNFAKVEENVPAGELKLHTLRKASVDGPIIKELGEAHETYLADLWTMLEKQPNGEKGNLLTNGYANIFYVRDKNGALWAVFAHWHSDDGGWSLFANSVTNPNEWNAGNQVASR